MLKKNRVLALVLALVLTLALAACGGPKNTPEELAAKYAEALEQVKPSAMFALISEQQKKAIVEDSDEDMDMDEELKLLDEMAQESLQELKDEYGNVKITCTVQGEGTLDADEKAYIIEDFKDYYEITVEDVALYTVDVSIVTGDEEEEDTLDCYLILIDGEWYLDLDDSDSF